MSRSRIITSLSDVVYTVATATSIYHHPQGIEMTTATTIAHLSDVHLSPVVGFTPAYWNAKRLLGFANWRRKRRHVHVRSIADKLVADIKARVPDHIAITGDLVNIGLPTEYEAAAAWLATVGTPNQVSLVPGNHDIYTHLVHHPGIGRWQPYMTSDEWGASQGGLGGPAAQPRFPYVRRVGAIAIIGLCSAVPTRPAVASGHLGALQISKARDILLALGAQGIFRLVMIHHPPLPGQAGRHRDLTDAATFAEVLKTVGAELVLHGHNHRNMRTELASSTGAVPVIGIASASASQVHGHEALARYNIYQISGMPRHWEIAMTGFGLSEIGGSIVELERRMLPVGRVSV